MTDNTALRLEGDAAEREEDSSGVPPAVRRYASMIAKAREKRGLSQRNLAEAAGISHELMRRIEAGLCDPRLGVAVQLALILGIAAEPSAFAKIAYGQIGANRISGETP